jgi:peptidoglycan/xylan/chitin deacetylase (PgdA/CDA1 family)
MQALMYHYVRPAPAGLPYFRYLHIDNFRRQLDWLQRNQPVLSREAFLKCLSSGRAERGAILTFDDGLADHFNFVLPELVARGLWGIFYISTAALDTSRILDVHRIQLILGRCGGERAIALAHRLVSDNMLEHERMEEFRQSTYRRQDNDEATMLFKRLLNYFVKYEYREKLLDRLFVEVFDPFEIRELGDLFYVDAGQLRQMHQAGMLIGSHSSNHLVMSKLPVSEQRAEIVQSFGALSDIIGEPVITFCYPYGGSHTFTKETEMLLAKQGSLFSFSVEPRDITDVDLVEHRQSLPRYDCNEFPFGKAHFGANPPSI